MLEAGKKPKSKQARPVAVREPNRVIYAVASALISVFFKLVYRLRIDKSALRDLKPPYIVLCNHICNIDFLISGAAMYPQKMNFMTAALYFQNRLLGWLITLMGCFPKQQFVADMQAVRNTVRVLQRGGVVVLFPAGQSSFTGQDTLIDPSIAKLLRLARVPVVAMRTQGAHIAFPKWNMKKLRRSRIECEVRPLFTVGEIEAMSDEQIYRGVVEALAFDDYEWQRAHRIAAAKPRCAEGLEQLLFLCPACGGEFTIQAHKNQLRCAHCGKLAEMDEYGFLCAASGEEVPDTPTAWYRWQMAQYRAKLDADFSYAEPAKLYRIRPNGKLDPVGECEATLTLACLRVQGKMEGEPIDWVIDNRLSGVFPHEKRTCFEIMIDGQLYAIAPLNPRATFKFILLKEVIYRALRGL